MNSHCGSLTENNRKILNDEIWKIFEQIISPNIDLTSEKSYYKKFNNILQAINLLKDKNLFFVKYNLYEGCSICTIANKKIKYLVPYMEIKENDLKLNIKLENIVIRKLTIF